MATNELLLKKLKELVEHYYICYVIKNSSTDSYFYINQKTEKLRSEIAVLESQAKEPSDEDIANWADNINNNQFGCPRNRIAHYAAIIGAKAMRDGKIKTQTKLKG